MINLWGVIHLLRIVIVILCLNIATGCSFNKEMYTKSKYNYSVEDFVKEGYLVEA